MGTNRTQALGVFLFMLALVVIAAGMASGGSLLLILPGLFLIGASFMAFLKAKPWENIED